MILLAAPLLAAAQTTQHVKVLEYCPAPGQFVGKLPAIDATMSEADRLQACEAQLADQLPVSLGAFGGYITFGFTEPIANTRGSDLRILGNAYYAAADPVYGAVTIGGSIEPGIVYAGVGTSPETAEWYELAGSEYYTTATPNVTITYQRPDAEQGEHTLPYSVYDRYIPFRAEWTDRNGTERDTVGYMMKLTFHNQSYYPTWADADKLTFRGSRLPDNAINRGGDGTDSDNPQNWISYRYAADAYGYADAAPTDDKMYNTFDLDWAVDSNGNPVKLAHADFIRVQTGVLQMCGWIGEQSTEVCSVENLHLREGYDDNPIVITPRQRPTAINHTTADGNRHEVARYTADGQRISTPKKGVNIVRYSDGTVKKVVM